MKLFLYLILFLNFHVWAQSTGKTLTGNALQLYIQGTQTSYLLANGSGVISEGTINRLGAIASAATGYTQFSGYLYPAASGTADAQQTIGISANTYNGIMGPARTASLSGGDVLLRARVADTNGIITFRGNTISDGVTTAPTTLGFVLGNGLWTFGKSGETGTHTIRGAMSISNGLLLSNLTSGSVPFIGTSGLVTQDNANLFWDAGNKRLGITTSAPSFDISLGNGATKNIGMERASSGTGNSLIVFAGGSASGATDSNGGQLQLRPGLTTGTGNSNIAFATYTPNSSSSSADNVISTKMTLNGNGYLGIGVTTPTAPLTVLGTHVATATLGSAIGSNVEFTNMTLTDNLTTGTAANLINTRVGNLTYTASNPVTITRAAGLRINPVVAGNNSTVTTEVLLDIPSASLITGSGVVGAGYALSVAAPTSATTNYAASFTGNVGMGGLLTPMAQLDVAAQAVSANSSEPLSLTSARAAIVTGNMVGGISFKSNDTNLTAPGLNVAYIDATATATHTASVLSTKLDFYTTNTLTTALAFTINADKTLTAPVYGAGALSSDASGNFSSGTLSIANGGTNSTATPTAGGVGYGTGTAHAYTASAPAGAILVSTGTTAPIFTNTVSGVTAFASGLKFSTTATTITAYEEGTWTPTLALSGSLGTAVITTSVGRYTTIGNRTCISGYFLVTKGSGSGNMTFTNLPKTSTNLSNFYQNLNANFFSGVTVPALRSQTFAYVATNSATLVFQFNSTSGGASTSIAASDLGATAEVIIEGCYQSQ